MMKAFFVARLLLTVAICFQYSFAFAEGKRKTGESGYGFNGLGSKSKSTDGLSIELANDPNTEGAVEAESIRRLLAAKMKDFKACNIKNPGKIELHLDVDDTGQPRSVKAAMSPSRDKTAEDCFALALKASTEPAEEPSKVGTVTATYAIGKRENDDKIRNDKLAKQRIEDKQNEQKNREKLKAEEAFLNSPDGKKKQACDAYVRLEEINNESKAKDKEVRKAGLDDIARARLLAFYYQRMNGEKNKAEAFAEEYQETTGKKLDRKKDCGLERAERWLEVTMKVLDKKCLVFLLLNISFVLVSCNVNENSASSSSGGSSGPITTYKSSAGAVAQSATGYRLVRLDGVTPIDGSENDILVCTPKMEYCKQTCLAVYRPEFTRWSVFKTDYLSGGSCVGYAMAYPDGSSIPQMKYWRGTFHYTTGVLGYCSVDAAHPDFDGRAYFDFVVVPSGQISPAPGGARTYYLHSWFSLANGAITSFMPRTFNPPGMWTYSDSAVTAGEITPTLSNGFACIKESEISNAFQ